MANSSEQRNALDSEQRTWAHVLPLAVFMGVMLLMPLLKQFGLSHNHPDKPWYVQKPEYWVYPLQCVICTALLLRFRKFYQIDWGKSWLVGIVAGVIGIGFWILPTHLYSVLELGSEAGDDPKWYKWLGLAPREEGFDAAIFSNNPSAWWSSVLLRFYRAVIVVALVEELFWRGFLMRYLMKPDGKFWKVPFGEFSWKSFGVVTGLFMLAHAPVDWFGALCFGSIMYWVAVKTKSLFACILMHAVANLIMGWYAVSFQKYGLW